MAEPCTWNSNQYALRTDLSGNKPPESARKSVADIRRAWEARDYLAAFPFHGPARWRTSLSTS
jgi:hypothetical protein